MSVSLNSVFFFMTTEVCARSTLPRHPQDTRDLPGLVTLSVVLSPRCCISSSCFVGHPCPPTKTEMTGGARTSVTPPKPCSLPITRVSSVHHESAETNTRPRCPVQTKREEVDEDAHGRRLHRRP